MRILSTSKNNCKNCYKCIRTCPLKAIEFSNFQAQIIDDDCVLCGMCYNVCPQDAKRLVTDIEFIKTWLLQGEEVIISIAPSYLSDFYKSDFSSIKNAFMALGFKDVMQTAEAATYVKKNYEEKLSHPDTKMLISSCCPTVNLLIQKHYPSLLPFLADTPSPMVVHGEHIKKRHPNSKVVFVGPCISKKHEQLMNKDCVDAVLSFKEMKQWFLDDGIAYDKKDKNTPVTGRTNQFPTAGGIVKSFTTYEPSIHYLSIDGMGECIDALEDIKHGIIDNCFIEMSACKGSCTGGPLRNRIQHTPVKSLININRHLNTHDYIIDDYVVERKQVFDNLSTTNKHLDDDTLNTILKKMGKTDAKMQLDCGSCGYNTCLDKAKAIALGKADLTMCLPYLKDKAESFSDHVIHSSPNGVIVLNDKLQVQVMNQAACTMLGLKNNQSMLSENIAKIKDPTMYYDFLESKKTKANTRYYFEGFERYIDETIAYDKQFNIYVCILRDITKEVKREIAKTETQKQALKITDDVLLKQMRAVHEIASLLGETTADSKAALTKLKAVISDE
ncbi:MAG: [Fe-Fe] hydrogenase large subunit C-terminal domain-containing protein [Bacillota bacterium]